MIWNTRESLIIEVMREYSLAILKIVDHIRSTTCGLKPLLSLLMLKLLTLMTFLLIHRNLRFIIWENILKMIRIFKKIV